jgi:hypothetical protein
LILGLRQATSQRQDCQENTFARDVADAETGHAGLSSKNY